MFPKMLRILQKWKDRGLTKRDGNGRIVLFTYPSDSHVTLRLTPHVTDSPSDSHVSLSREPWALGPLPAPPRGLSQKRIDRSGGEGGRGKSGVTGGGLRAKGALLELALS